MRVFSSNQGDAAMARLDKGSDLLESLHELARHLEVHAGAIQVIGALSSLALGYYDQERRQYETLDLPGRWELASAIGNVSMKEGGPFVHLHVVASGRDGRAVGGHAMPGCTVFVGEAHVRALGGSPPVREPDDETGLALWA